jgi:hypothetical protein
METVDREMDVPLILFETGGYPIWKDTLSVEFTDSGCVSKSIPN